MPKAFRTDVSEMWITKNEVTCKITLKLKDDDKRQRELNELLQIIKKSPFAEDFIPPHDDAEAPDPFAELASAKDAKT